MVTCNSSSFSPRPIPRHFRPLSKKFIADVRFAARLCLSKPLWLVFLSLVSLFLTFTLLKQGLEDVIRSYLSQSSTINDRITRNHGLDPCTQASPQILLQFDPSNRSSAEFNDLLPSDVDPPALIRVFTAFFEDYLFEPTSDIIVNLTSAGRGLPTDIRNSLSLSQAALQILYRDDTIVVNGYSLGYSHLDRVRGSRHIFHLTSSTANHSSTKGVAVIQRTFDGKCYVSVRQYESQTVNNPIYILVPYSKRPARLKWFLSQFDHLRSSNANVRLFLAVCKEIEEDMETVHQLVLALKFSQDVTVTEVPGDQTGFFSRAVAIREGSRHVPADCIMFISDVDMYIHPMFFDSCRLNAIRGSQVYFPLFYSLFARKMRIEKDAGYWRDSSYGMSCMYRSDFDNVAAYKDAESKFVGWGGEDVALSQAFLEHDQYEVFRAVEPSLRHKWHLKHCEPLTSSYDNCVAMAFRQLGSMATVGRFLLDKDINAQSFFAEFAEEEAPPVQLIEDKLSEKEKEKLDRRKEFLRSRQRQAL